MNPASEESVVGGACESHFCTSDVPCVLSSEEERFPTDGAIPGPPSSGILP